MSENTAALAAPTAPRRVTPFEIKHVRVRVIGVDAGQRETPVPFTPRFDVR
jgi:hypothetical protein